jgi:predicted ATPase
MAIFYGIWACHYVGGEVAKQTDAASQFLAEAERHKDTVSLSVAHRIIGTTHLTRGELPAALTHLERARSLYELQFDTPSLQYQYGQDVGASILCYLSWVLWLQGDVDQALEVATKAIARAQELSHPHTQAFTICHARGMMDIFRRRSEGMQSYAEAVVFLCNEHDLSHWSACGRILEGQAAAFEGDTDQGIEMLGAGVDAWRKAGAKLWLPLFLTLQAQAHAKQGNNQAALDMIEQAIASSRQSGEEWFLAEILRTKATLLASSNSEDQRIEALLMESLDLARLQQARSWQLRAACDLALRWQRIGQTKKAAELLQTVYAQFTEGFDTADLRHAKGILDSLEPGGGGRRPPSRKRS